MKKPTKDQQEFMDVLKHFMHLEEQGIVDDALDATRQAFGAKRLFDNYGEAGWGPLAEAAGAPADEVAKMDRECRFLYAEYLVATCEPVT